MPVSILDIDINDVKFQSFVDALQKVQDQLAKLPTAWAAANSGAAAATASTNSATTAASASATAAGAAVGVVGQMATGVDLMTAALLYQTETLREEARVQAKNNAAMKQSASERAAEAKEKIEAAKQMAKIEKERHDGEIKQFQYVRSFWSDQATLTGKVVQNVGGLVKSIAGLGIGAAFGGLIGGGLGLFGLDGLAHGVGDRRVAAQGLGITSGENQAFQLNFGNRLGLGSDFIGRVQDTQADVSQRWRFQALGLGRQAETEDHATLSADVIRRARTLWDEAGPQGHNQQWMDARGLGGLMSFSQWQTIGAQKPGDIDRMTSQFAHDARNLAVSDPDQEAWQNLSVQLQRAAREIENTFVRGLAPLAGPIGDLSHQISTALQTFLANPQLTVWIKEFGDGIGHLATYMGTPEFRKQVADAAQSVMDFGRTITQLLPDLKDALSVLGTAAHVLAAIFRPLTDGPGDHGVMQYDREHPENGVVPPGPPKPEPAMPWYNGGVGQWLRRNVLGSIMPSASAMTVPGGGNVGASTVSPIGLISAIGAQESGNTDHPRDTFDGNPGQWHKGRYQMSEDMLRKYGITNPYDPSQVTPAAEREEAEYLAKFHGNVAAAIAAWNQGAGGVDREMKEASENRDGSGRDWLQRAPAGVQRYVSSVAQRMHVQVSVLNQTGAQIAVLANAVHQ